MRRPRLGKIQAKLNRKSENSLLVSSSQIEQEDVSSRDACRYMLVPDGTEHLKFHLLKDNMIKGKICGALDASCTSFLDIHSKVMVKNLTKDNFKKKDICSKVNLATLYLLLKPPMVWNKKNQRIKLINRIK